MLQTITDLQHKQAEFERNSGARERELKDLERRLSERAMAVVAEEARIAAAAAKLADERAELDRRSLNILATLDDLHMNLQKPGG
jgi:hypothetical protein